MEKTCENCWWYAESVPGEHCSSCPGPQKEHTNWQPKEPETMPNTPASHHETVAAMIDKGLDRGPSNPQRVRILNEAARLTGTDRNKTYGDPGVNLACAGELKDVFWRYAKSNPREISPAEGEALDQVMTKLARLATGAAKLDNYIDGAAYFAIAGEVCASKPS